MLQGRIRKDTRTQILLEAWFLNELSNVTTNSTDLELLCYCRFLGISGLISRPDGMVGTQWYRVIPLEIDPNVEEKQIICFFSIPFYRGLDSKSLESMMTFTLETIREINNNDSGKFRDAESTAFQRITPQLRSKLFLPKSTLDGASQTWAENIARLYFRMKSGVSIVNVDGISEFENPQFVKAQKILRAKLSRARSKLAGITDTSFLRKIVLIPVPAMLRTISPSSALSLLGTIIAYDRNNRLSLVVVIVGIPLLDVKNLELVLTQHILSVFNERKYSRGLMEQEILQIIATNKDLSSQHVIRLYGEEKFQTAQKEVKELTSRLLEANYPIIRLT